MLYKSYYILFNNFFLVYTQNTKRQLFWSIYLSALIQFSLQYEYMYIRSAIIKRNPAISIILFQKFKKIVWNIIVFVCMLFNIKAWRRNNILINIKIQAKFVPFKEKFLHWHLNAYFNNRAFSFCHLQIKSWIQIMNKYWRIKIKEKKNRRWRSSWCF